MIKVDPYKRFQRKIQSNKSAKVTSINLSNGRVKIGVDLRWYLPKDFQTLPNIRKNKLREWQHSLYDKQVLEESKKSAIIKKRKDTGNNDTSGKGKAKAWRQKLKKVAKAPIGLKIIISVLV